MNRYLLVTSDQSRYPLSKQHPGEPYHLCVKTGELEGDTVLLIANPELELQDPSDRLVGTWNLDGSAAGPINADLYQQFRDLGNTAAQVIRDENGQEVGIIRAGIATESLDYHGVSGDYQRQLGENGNLYPSDNPPFLCECRMLHNPIYGYYPRWEISMEDGADVGRDPSVRNVRVFSSADCLFPSEYLYTTGAFIYGDSEWRVDADGEPLKIWYTESNQFSQAADPLYFAIYWSETENGRFQLANAEDRCQKLFWETNQESPPEVRFLVTVLTRVGISAFSNAPLTRVEKLAVRQELLVAGVSLADIRNCAAMQGDITHRQAFIRLLVCVHDGTITLP